MPETQTLTLTDFLLARIAEDEAWARATAGPDYAEPHDQGAPGHHLRVLAECEAKRRIVEEFGASEQVVSTYDSDNPNNPPSYWQEWGNRHALELAVALLASIYADHPDFDESWRP